MVITVDLGAEPAVVTLDEPEDCKRFSVAVAGGDVAGLADALRASAAGRMQGDDAMIDVAWVRRAAAGRVGDGWDDDFAAMLSFARTKGWLDESGGAVRAHVEQAA